MGRLIALHAFGASLMAGAVAGFGALAQAASDGAPPQSLYWSAGGVGAALGVGWLLIKRSDQREQRALERADAEAAKLQKIIDRQTDELAARAEQLIDERARRLAAEAQLSRRDRDAESRRHPNEQGNR